MAAREDSRPEVACEEGSVHQQLVRRFTTIVANLTPQVGDEARDAMVILE